MLEFLGWLVLAGGVASAVAVMFAVIGHTSGVAGLASGCVLALFTAFTWAMLKLGAVVARYLALQAADTDSHFPDLDDNFEDEPGGDPEDNVNHTLGEGTGTPASERRDQPRVMEFGPDALEDNGGLALG